MTIRNITLFLVLNIITFSVSAQNSDPKNRNITVFTVDKKPVTAEEFIYLYKKNHQNRKDEFTQEKIEEYLELFINFKLKVREAQDRGIDTTAAFLKEFNTYSDELRKPYLPDSKLIDSLVTLTYNRMKEEINASHILVAVAAEATREDESKAYDKIIGIRNEALKSSDFGSLAKAVSDDPSAKVNNGNLGYFTGLQMVYAFESAAYAAKIGDITMPIRTKFGYHLLKINDRRPSSGEVEVSHILIRTGENKDNEKSKNIIFDTYEQLEKGVSWDELCKQYSEDPSSKENGGKLRPFGIGSMASVPEFERAAFALQNPNEYSDPFQTQFGWHIVKLERKIPVPSFEEAAPSLKARISRDERVQISKLAVYEKLKTDYGFAQNDDVKTKVVALADTTLKQATWKIPSYINAEKEILFKLGTRAYPVKEFFDYVKQNQKRSPLTPEKYMDQLINSFIESRLLQVVEERIISRSPEYKWLLNEYYEGILLFDIMEKEIWNKASIDSAGQQDYYKKNASAYKAGERLKATIYSATTKDHIEKLKILVAQNDTLKSGQEVEALKIRMEKGFYEKQDRIILSKIPWSKGLFAAENNNLYYLIEVKDILAPGPKTFQEARPDIISDYQNFLEKNWIKSLKKKFVVKLDKKGKALVLNELLRGNTP